jgi:hypothetical protein
LPKIDELIYSAHAHPFIKFMHISDFVQKSETAHLCSPSVHKTRPFLHSHHYLTAITLLCITQALLVVRVFAYEETVCVSTTGSDAAASCQRISAALGLNSTFGRWNTAVRLVYDHDNAPAFFSEAKVMELIGSAVEQWQRVSDVQFEILGADRNIADDFSLPNIQQDGIVRIAWDNSGGRPSPGTYDPALGYAPYDDGSVGISRFINSIGVLSLDYDNYGELTNLLVHELGHVLGLGHSNNPDSVMFASPRNFLAYPRADDIRAMQVLYGGETKADPDLPVPEWLYHPPRQASAAVIQYLFKPNQSTPDGNHLVTGYPNREFSVLTEEIVAYGASEGITLRFGGVGNFNNTTNIEIRPDVVVVDPRGYIYKSLGWIVWCPARSACSGGGVKIADMAAIRNIPGLWKIFIVDPASNTTLWSTNLPVLTSTTSNQPPVAMVRADATAEANTVRLIIAATDAESNNVSVIWHTPGLRPALNSSPSSENGLVEPLGTDGLAIREISFDGPGNHVLFVELADDSPRLRGEGKGFSTLLRLNVTLPLAPTADALKITGTSTEPAAFSYESGASPALNAQVLASITRRAAVYGKFSLAASSDYGATTSLEFSTNDSLVIAGSVTDPAADANRSADIFVVAHSRTQAGDSLSYRDSSGAFRLWDSRFESLEPAYRVNALGPGAGEIYSGKLPAGDYRIFIGYRVTGSTVVHYNQTPMHLVVHE